MSETMWKPIESAPTQKGYILVTGGEDYPSIEVFQTPFFVHHGKLSAHNYNSGNIGSVHWVTHWMELPAPPPAA